MSSIRHSAARFLIFSLVYSIMGSLGNKLILFQEQDGWLVIYSLRFDRIYADFGAFLAYFSTQIFVYTNLDMFFAYFSLRA